VIHPCSNCTPECPGCGVVDDHLAKQVTDYRPESEYHTQVTLSDLQHMPADARAEMRDGFLGRLGGAR
jgi:hypothetical protein